MSRLADALFRAAGEGKVSAPPPHHAEETDSPFASPWDFDAAASDRGAAPPRPRLAVAHTPSTSPSLPQTTWQPPQAPPAGTPTVRLDSQLAMAWPQPFAPEVAGRLVVMPQSSPATVRQYQHAAAALEQVQREKNVRTVAIVSAVAGEGRTLTAANLALMLSEAFHRRVLLIDTHLEQPRLHHVFQVSAGAGLRRCLQLASDHPVPFVELTAKLALLPGGRGERSADEVLGSEPMRQLLAKAAADFDWVILDTAPASEQPDAALLSRLVDRVVLVVRAGRTLTPLVEQLVEQLGRERVAGVVLNQASDAALTATPSRAGDQAGPLRLN